MHTSSSEETTRSQSMNDWSMAIIFAYSRSSLEAPWNDREPRTYTTRGNRPARVHFQLRPGAPLDVGRGADPRSLASLARRASHGHLRESLATEHRKRTPRRRGVRPLDPETASSEGMVRGRCGDPPTGIQSSGAKVLGGPRLRPPEQGIACAGGDPRPSMHRRNCGGSRWLHGRGRRTRDAVEPGDGDIEGRATHGG